MRIGVVTTWFERGAAYVSRQYRDILASTHEVFIYARGGEAYGTGDPHWDTPDVTWAKRVPSSVPTIVDLDDYVGWLKRNRIQLVFFNEQWWWPAVIQTRRLGIITGAYIDYYTEQTVPFFAVYDFLVCNTERHFSAFSWHTGATYIPWGTDVDVFKPSKDREINRAGITFFHSGGISPQRKGCDLVIRAFSALQGDARLVIHSQRNLQSMFPHLSRTMEELKSQGRLECHEKTVPAPGLFHLGDVYVYPTRLEGIGLTILEAAACGLPVIVTDCGPMNEFITHGDNGRLVKVSHSIARADGYYWPQSIVSVESLQEQMQWYVDNTATLPEMKMRARTVAELRFDWKKSSDQVLQVFANAVRNTSAGLEKIESDIAFFEQSQDARYRVGNLEYLKRRIEIEHPSLYQKIARVKTLLKSRHSHQNGKK